MKGFSSKWISWIKTFILGGSVAVNVNDIEGVIPRLVDGGLSILQHADDTILFMDHDPDKARNMKLLLFAFEQASGLKINFHKSRLFCFEAAQEELVLYTDPFGCKAGNLPINYLGIPIHFKKLRNCDWVKGSLRSWITSIRDSFGRGMKTKGNTYLLNGLRILPFLANGYKNCSLLMDYGNKNFTISSKSLAQVESKIGDSQFWSCLMKVKPDFLRFGTFLVKDGSQVRFWEDTWLDGIPLKDQYPSSYHIARSKFISIAEAMSTSPPPLHAPNFPWRRQLFGTNLVNWLSLLSHIEGAELS
ncbi:LOW QUALITY PROTEIN: hypothetical protein U9M48_040562 [Paspalum notatum var. saurae]|uniref:Reverse transcriptase domain-containing protein n=1 Tax=Paspalum notatum var. saurae TaxID=547442 RepID=A0AAQ3URD3_PASNO